MPFSPSDWPEYAHRFVIRGLAEGFAVERVAASDGARLIAYRSRTRHPKTVVMVAPPGMPFLLMAPLAVQLSRTYNILSWEVRGAPFLGLESGPPETAGVDRLADDLLDLLAWSNVSDPHILTASGGAFTVGCAVSYKGLRPASLAMMGPNGIAKGTRDTPYKSVFIPLLLAASDPETGGDDRICHAVMRLAGGRRHHSEIERQAQQLFLLNFNSVAAIKQYGVMIRAFIEGLNAPRPRHPADWSAVFDLVGRLAPVLIQHSQDDDVVDVGESQEAASRNPAVQLMVSEAGGHLAMFTRSAAMADLVASFLESVAGLEGAKRPVEVVS